jgi:hypothetical protein
MKEIIGSVIAISGLLNVAFPFYKFYLSFSSKNKKANLLKLDIESCTFLSDDNMKEIYKEEQIRALYYTYKGIDVSSKNQKLIFKLSLKLNDEYSWNQIKNASRYFKYSEDNISINIKKEDKFDKYIYLITSILFIGFGLWAIIFDIFLHVTSIKLFASIFTYGIFSILFGAYFINRFVAPVYLAQSIEKRLKKLETQENV